MKKISLFSLCRISLIAALYFCISFAFAPISFGVIQVRISEALTILPAISPLGIWGVTIGCALTNLYGISTGANILGAADVFFGTFATLLAALATRKLAKTTFKGLPILATLPPIIINAIVVGAELSFAIVGSVFNPFFFVAAFQVGLGQLISCSLLGIILFKALKKSNIKF